MKMSLRTLILAAGLGIALLLTACGGGTTAPAASTGGGSGPVTQELSSVGESLAFDKTALTVATGQQVTVRFTNTSAAQQHNWVLVNGGSDVAQTVASAGLTAGADANYLPSDGANVFASTPLANPGETVETTFTAPAAGTYEFICTVPGHYPLMKGTLTVN